MQDAAAQHSLREEAVLAERDATGVVPLAGLWRELRDGTSHVQDAFFGNARCYFVLETPTALDRRTPLSSRGQHVLESLLCGEYPKVLAARLGVSLSTISGRTGVAMERLGFDKQTSRFHPLLVLAARADRENSLHVTGRFADFQHQGRRFRVVGAPRPEGGLADLLSPAEYAVVRGLVEGKNYVEIARGRGTSTRTVANQVAAAFRRLGVSGRGSLLSRLANEQPAWA